MFAAITAFQIVKFAVLCGGLVIWMSALGYGIKALDQ